MARAMVGMLAVRRRVAASGVLVATVSAILAFAAGTAGAAESGRCGTSMRTRTSSRTCVPTT